MSVGPVVGPVQRPGDDRDLSEIFGRVEALERAHGFGDIRYDFLNVGDWLQVKTTGTGGDFAAGMSFLVDAGDFNVVALDGQIYMDGSSMSLFSEDFDMSFDSQKEIQILSRGPGANLWSFTGSLAMVIDNGFDVTLGPGTSLTVHDSIGGDIFKVDEDGDLHGKTGKALTFDL